MVKFFTFPDKLSNYFSKSINQIFFSNLILFFISIIFLLNINNGHDWGGDFSMYIMHALNIAEGKPYAETGYIYNTEVVYGPPSYPPIFPLILSPFVSIWGLNLKVLKFPVVFCFILFLFYINNSLLPRKEISPGLKTFFILALGFFPYFFQLSESILSDLPFLLFCFLALNLIDYQINELIKTKINFGISLLSGFLIYLSFGTRTIGLVLIPVAILYSFLKKKTIDKGILISISTAIILTFLQNYLLNQPGGYLDYIPKTFTGIFTTLINSIIYYFSLFFGIFSTKNFIISSVFFVLIFETLILGFIQNIKRGLSSFDVFFVIYLCVLLIWPSYQGYRFLVPVLPLYFLYIFVGFDFVMEKINNPKIKTIFILLFIGFFCINYYQAYVHIFPHPISALEEPETQEIFRQVKFKTNDEDIILFFKPRVLALFTGRKSLAMKLPDPEGDALKKMKKFGVDYVILNKNHLIEYQPELKNYIFSNPTHFFLIFENSKFNFYKVLY